MADLPASGPIPTDGDLDRQVTSLETDMREVKAGIGRLEVSFARMDERMTNLTDRVSAVEVSVDKLRASMEACNESLRAYIDASNESLRASIDRLRAVLDSRMVTGWQMFGIFSGLMATFFAMGGAAVAIARYAGLLH